jgi:short subunit dehydrogenase-like uncharacterized protein
MTDKEESPRFLIYGAYGYTGALITQHAVEKGLQPVLGGHDAKKLAGLADSLGLESRAFSLDDPAGVDSGLAGMQAVLHCAGPYIHTFQPMVEACLRNHVHYLDLTGEIQVYENLAGRTEEAQKAGIVLLPGVGFDVVPSDCLALHLKDRLPTAARLTLALRGLSRTSQGTARTAAEGLGDPPLIRRGGELTPIKPGSKVRLVDFGRGPVKAVAITWGDISTAYYSTGIPNIEVYSVFPASVRSLLRVGNLLGKGITGKGVKSLFKRMIRTWPAGPSEQERERGLGLLWGEAVDNTGRRAVSRLTTPEAYKLTAMTAVLATERILKNKTTPGFQTPARAFGKNFILEIPGCVREDVI